MHYVDLGNTKINRRPRPRKTRGGKGKFFKIAVVFFILLTVGGLVVLRPSFGFSAFLTPVSVFSKIVHPQKIVSTDGRTNVLLIAVDSREDIDPRCEGAVDGGGPGLTDTIILASLGMKEKDIVLISIPRDLWVDTVSYEGKINGAYSFGEGGVAGADLLSRVVGGVTGVPVHYYAVVDFQGFEKAIDVLGGVEVDVERPFDDYKYPVRGEECAEKEEDKWEHIHFDAGLQSMDGDRALKFVRSRHSQGPEGSDFARSRRQQKVLLAVKRKFFSLSTFSNWEKVRNLYETFEDYVLTNFNFWELEQLFRWAQDMENMEIKMEVLDGQQGLLHAVREEGRYHNAWVLIPRAGDYSNVRDYIENLLFSGR